jgi:hypothetical protein
MGKKICLMVKLCCRNLYGFCNYVKKAKWRFFDPIVGLVEFFPGIKRCSWGGDGGGGGEGRHLQFCKADIRD